MVTDQEIESSQRFVPRNRLGLSRWGGGRGQRLQREVP
jgi:hypothetical protein